jgi:hypothetical protein
MPKATRKRVKRDDLDRGPRSVRPAPGAGADVEMGERTSAHPEDTQMPPKTLLPGTDREKR